MIAIGSDHGGYKLKEELKKYLEEKEIAYIDVGCYSEDHVDYPDLARAVCKEVKEKRADKGILVCRTGYGMAIVANKFRGIRAASISNEETAKFSRMHNDLNVLTLGADYISTNQAICILRQWLATEFEGGRHERRLKIIEEIENENMK